MNLTVPRIALKVPSPGIEAPNSELGTVESQLKSIIAAPERRLIMPPLGEQSGKY
jgi:hypothetical protein